MLYLDPSQVAGMRTERLIARRTDWHLMTASTADECLQLAVASAPDGSVLEPMLSDRDGREVLRALRLDMATSHRPFIALSTKSYPQHSALDMQTGLFRCLTMPFKFTKWMQAIDGALPPAAAS